MDKVALRTGPNPFRITPQEVHARVRPQHSKPVRSNVAASPDQVHLSQRTGPVPAAYVKLDLSNLVQHSVPADNTRVTYTDKLAQSMHDFSKANHKQAAAYGGFAKGMAKSTLYAPAGAMEAAGRTVIAMTGGEVVYRGKSPIDHMGSGFSEMGQSAHRIAVATDEKLAAMGRTVMYAPLAGAEAVAHGAGVAAGTTVRVVSESFIGKEFAAGYSEARH